MPIAKNMDELNKLLSKELEVAIREVSDEALADMYNETGRFYMGRKPKKYKRTGALGNTPKVTVPKQIRTSKYETEISFDAYLDKSHKYLTGDKPYMEQVLMLANYGIPWQTKKYFVGGVAYGGKFAAPTVGKKGFWERAEKRIEKDLYKVMKRYFKTI